MSMQQWADDALAGWHAAKRGDTFDPGASPAWQDGWRTYAHRRSPT